MRWSARRRRARAPLLALALPARRRPRVRASAQRPSVRREQDARPVQGGAQFSSLLPQFGHSFPALLALGLLFGALTLGWLSAYALAMAHAGDTLRRPRTRRAIEAASGTALVALGIRLAAPDR